MLGIGPLASNITLYNASVGAANIQQQQLIAGALGFPVPGNTLSSMAAANTIQGLTRNNIDYWKNTLQAQMEIIKSLSTLSRGAQAA